MTGTVETEDRPESADPLGDAETEQDGGLAPGAKFGRYVIVRKMGAGGMGAVYEGTHSELKKRVAIKTLHPEVAHDPQSRARFLQEGQAASKIRHPHVVDVSDVGIEGRVPYLVMEYLDGEDLASRIQREGAMAPESICDVMLPVMAALMAAHDEGIVHRDLKPENIFLSRTRDGAIVPKVLDFGISKMSDAKRSKSLTASASLLGTPYYMSPEQAAESKNVDGRTDQYALGVILYECATGVLPFEAATLVGILNAVISGSFVPPRARRPELPEAFEAVVLRAMQRAPEDRFPSVHALGAALMPFAGAEARVLWERVFLKPRPLADSPAPALAPAPAARDAPSAANTVAAYPAYVPPARAHAGTLEPSNRATPPAAPPRWRGAWIGLAAVLAVGGVVAGVVVSHGEPAAPPRVAHASARPPPARPYRVSVRVSPERAAILLDGRPVGVGAFERELAHDGAPHTLLVAAEGFEPQELNFRDAPPPERITLVAIPAAPAPVATAVSAGEEATGSREARRHHRSRRSHEDPAGSAPAAPVRSTAGVNGAPLVD